MNNPKKLIIEIEDFNKYFSKWDKGVEELQEDMNIFWFEKQEICRDITDNIKEERIIKYKFWFDNEIL